MIERDAQTYLFSLEVGGLSSLDGLVLQNRCWGVYVANYTSRWVEIPDGNEFVPPLTRQTIPLQGVMQAKARFAAPGTTVQPAGTAGQICIIQFTERHVQPSGGLVGVAPPVVTLANAFVVVTDSPFSADPTGVGDSTAAIQAAVNAAAGKIVLFPPGIYRVSGGITVGRLGQRIMGTAMTGTTCVIRASAAIDIFTITNGFVKIENIELDGNGVGGNGILFQSAFRSVVSMVDAHTFTGDGFRFDMPVGSNNNFVRCEYCRANSNNRGFAVNGFQTDNNGLVFLDCEAQSNTGQGLLYRGVGVRIIGGQYSSNGTFGVELGQAADAGFTADSILLYPWLETNGTDGVGTTKSVRNRILTSSGFTVTAAGTSTDMHEIIDVGGSTGSAQLVIRGEQVGGPLGGINVGGVGAAFMALEQIVFTTQVVGPGLIAPGAQVVLGPFAMPAGTFARAGDACWASVDVDLLGQTLTAYVNAANNVTAVLFNGTAGGINLGAGVNLRIYVAKR